MHTLSWFPFMTVSRKIGLNLKCRYKQNGIAEADLINKARKKQKVKCLTLQNCFYFVLISGEYTIYSKCVLQYLSTKRPSCPKKQRGSNKLGIEWTKTRDEFMSHGYFSCLFTKTTTFMTKLCHSLRHFFCIIKPTIITSLKSVQNKGLEYASP